MPVVVDMLKHVMGDDDVEIIGRPVDFGDVEPVARDLRIEIRGLEQRIALELLHQPFFGAELQHLLVRQVDAMIVHIELHEPVPLARAAIGAAHVPA